MKDLYSYEFGFSKIIETIIESKKPIVGHNMMFDVGFIYNQFIGNLPESYDEF
jgi:poly(A)-specific ribonuclease